MSTEDVTAEREGLAEIAGALRPAIAKHVCNVSNLPDGMKVAALGCDMTPLIDGLADALADLLAARDRRVRAEALREAADFCEATIGNALGSPRNDFSDGWRDASWLILAELRDRADRIEADA